MIETKRALLHTWNPARYSNLTNNPKQYMQAYKKAEEMTTLIEAAYALLSAVLVPDEAPATASFLTFREVAQRSSAEVTILPEPPG